MKRLSVLIALFPFMFAAGDDCSPSCGSEPEAGCGKGLEGVWTLDRELPSMRGTFTLDEKGDGTYSNFFVVTFAGPLGTQNHSCASGPVDWSASGDQVVLSFRCDTDWTLRGTLTGNDTIRGDSGPGGGGWTMERR